MPMRPMQQTPTMEDDPSVGETFVDGPVGVNFVNGNMHITFFTVRLDHRAPTQPPVNRVALRIVIPVPGAVDLRTTIDNMLQILREQGLIQATPPTPMVSGPLTRQ